MADIQPCPICDYGPLDCRHNAELILEENKKLRAMLAFALVFVVEPCAEGCGHVDCPEVLRLYRDAAAAGVKMSFEPYSHLDLR